MSFKSLLLVVVALPFIYSPAQAETSPWPMFRHDLRHTGRTLYTGPATPVVQWVYPADDGIASSPTLGTDGTIYVGVGGYHGSEADTSLFAITPDGNLKWRFPTNGGVFSSPAIGPDGTIYFGSADYNLYAVEDSVTYGKLKWKVGFWNKVYSSPAIGPDGTIYVGSLDFDIYALSPDGQVKWDYHTNWCIFSSPAIGPEGEIYVGSKDEKLYALEDSVTYGKLRWAHTIGGFYDGHLVDSSPAIGEDGTIYVGVDPYGAFGQNPVPVNDVFFAVNPDGTRKWTFYMDDGVESSPAIGPDGTIYVGSYDGNLYAIRDEGSAGVLQWAFPTGGAVDGSPTVDASGTIYIGSRDSTLYAINPDGSLMWNLPTGGGIESSPTIHDGILYIGTFAGDLYAIGTGGPDVGVGSVDLPERVLADSVYAPVAIVGNYRSGSESFEVTCLIDRKGQQVYGDTLLVSDLPETTSVEAVFDPWQVGPDLGVVYNVTVITSLAGDSNLYNDTLTVQVTSISPAGVFDQEEVARHLPHIDRCSPNPFRVESAIHYSIPSASVRGRGKETHVSLKIYDLSGREIRTLVNGPMTAGSHSAAWDGRDDQGRSVARGIHLCRLKVADTVDTRKILFLR